MEKIWRTATLFLVIALILTATVPHAGWAEKESCPVLGTGDFFPLKEPLTLTALVVNTAGQLSVSGSYVIEWIREKTNINLVITHELYGSEGEMRLRMMMNSGETLPDILLCTRWSKAECVLYGEQGLIKPLGEYLENCVNWNRLNEICGAQRRDDLTMANGEIYTYGSVNECFHLTHQARMWVYQPWIDLLCDGKLPETTEEFYVYLTRVATMDPNGNGINDEIPLSGQIIDGWAEDPFTFISNAFVHNNTIMGSSNNTVASGCYVDEEGGVHCNWVEDGYREALRYMNRIYSEGLLDSRTYTQNGEQLGAREKATPHLVGAAPGGLMPEATYALQDAGDNDWKNWTCLAPLMGPEGLRLSYQSSYNYFYNCNGLITRDCRYPEIAVQLFDLLASTEGTLVQNYGKEDYYWSYCAQEDGEAMNNTAPLYRDNTDAPLDDSLRGWPPDVQISSMYLSFRNALLLKEDGVNGEQLLWDWADLYDQFSPGMDSVYPNIAYTAEQARRITQYAAVIDAYVEKTTIQFIIGSKNVDTDWETYLNSLDMLGQNDYRQLLQQAYDQNLQKKGTK